MTLDAAALIAVERGSSRITAILDEVERIAGGVRVPAGVLGQVWRDGRTQARISRLLSADGTRVVALDEPVARASGALCAKAGTADVIDASVAVCAAQHGDAVVTGDPDDIRRLAPRLRIVVV